MSESSNASAWLTHQGETFFTSLPTRVNRSAVQDLIERIYFSESKKEKSKARSIVREWIYTTTPPSIAERELVKVTAKRIRLAGDSSPPQQVTLLPDVPSLPSFEIQGLIPGMEIKPRDVSHWLENLKSPTNERPVSALLVDRNQKLIAAAWNTNSAIRTRHAEMNLCDGGLEIPEGSTLYVSLKPCRMCAARIWENAKDPTKLRVLYFENDPGPLAQGTMLDPQSAARLHYLGAKHPLLNLNISRLVTAE